MICATKTERRRQLVADRRERGRGLDLVEDEQVVNDHRDYINSSSKSLINCLDAQTKEVDSMSGAIGFGRSPNRNSPIYLRNSPLFVFHPLSPPLPSSPALCPSRRRRRQRLPPVTH